MAETLMFKGLQPCFRIYHLRKSRGITNFERFRKRVLFSLNPKINYSLTSHLKNDSLKNKPRGPYNKVKE